MNNLSVVLDELAHLDGRCAACREPLPPLAKRSRQWTCDDVCHHVWIERLIVRFGETRAVIDARTGKVHAVPTRA